MRESGIRIFGAAATASERAAVNEVTVARTLKPRPGMAGAMESADGQVVTARSVRGKEGPNLHPAVQKKLDEIPAGERGRGHGRCAEPQCISQMLTRGIETKGAKSTAVLVRAPGHIDNGKPIKACPSCQKLLEHFGITDTASRTKP